MCEELCSCEITLRMDQAMVNTQVCDGFFVKSVQSFDSSVRYIAAINRFLVDHYQVYIGRLLNAV
jgi:hypothetical protein